MMLPIIILAGGYGTRLGDVTKNIPKSLVSINEKPFLYYQLELLRNSGFENIYMALGHMQDKIIDFLNDYKHVKYSLDNQDYGTGGAVKRTAALIKENSFFVIYGDSYLDIDYKNIQKKFMKSQKDSLMVIYKNKNQKDVSNVVYKGKIIEYDKKHKPEMEYIDYGVSIFSKKCFNVHEKSFDLSKIHKNMIAKNNLSSYVEKTPFYEIGSLNGIEDFSNYIKE